MYKMGLEKAFNILSESKLLKLEFDILRNCIILYAELLENSVRKKHKIIFRNVSAYFFVNNVKIKRRAFIEFEKNDYLELTSISLLEGTTEIKLTAEEKWVEQYGAKANIAIELWNRFIFLECELVEIDEKKYRLLTIK